MVKIGEWWLVQVAGAVFSLFLMFFGHVAWLITYRQESRTLKELHLSVLSLETDKQNELWP